MMLDTLRHQTSMSPLFQPHLCRPFPGYPQFLGRPRLLTRV